MKIIIGTFGQETNTFSQTRMDYKSLMPSGWIKAEKLVERYKGTGSYLGGSISAAGEESVEVVPIDSGALEGGSIMTEDCLEYVMSHICRQVSENLEGVDGIYLGMHGGGRTEFVEDLEVYTLKRIREVVGDLPIMSSLDLHCNNSPELVALSDGLFVTKEYPHIDCYKAGYLATKTLIRKIRKEINPVITLVNIPILLQTTTTNTFLSPMKEIKEYLASYCEKHSFIDVSICHGFSANDQKWAGSSVLIVSDDRDATKEAKELAEYFWSYREEFNPKLTNSNLLNPKEAISEALTRVKDGYVVINESSDNPGSGCPGDGTHLLKVLIELDIPKTVYMSILDPDVALQAHRAGVGSFIDIKLGGKTVPIYGKQLDLKNVEVLNLSNGNVRFVSPLDYKLKFTFGLSARLRHNNVEIVVVSIRKQAYDDRGLLMTGADINDYKIVCLKSTNHFRAFFQDRADAIINCETPGLRQTSFKSYPYKYVRRPIYPLDEGVVFTPLAVTNINQ